MPSSSAEYWAKFVVQASANVEVEWSATELLTLNSEAERRAAGHVTHTDGQSKRIETWWIRGIAGSVEGEATVATVGPLRLRYRPAGKAWATFDGPTCDAVVE